MPSNTASTLIEIRKEWLCTRCGHPLDFPADALAGLTLREMIEKIKALREEALAKHVCTSR